MSTENKKKRGRPPGSGKKKENLHAAMTPAEINEDAEMFKPDNLLARLPFESTNETSYPSNWNDMGKIAKLEWLTAHPRK